MTWGVITFPGSNCDQDCVHVLRAVLGQRVEDVWHEVRSLDGLDAVILPGGFAYGDYLRAGAVAATAPVIEAVRAFAESKGAKLGAVAQPLRAALTGRTTSPGIFNVLDVLGRQESLARLRDQAGP